MKDKEHFIAVQAKHDRDEFNRVTRSLVTLKYHSSKLHWFR